MIASGLMVADAAAVRMLDLLDNRNSPSALNVIEGSIPEEEKCKVKGALLRLQELISCFAGKHELQPSTKNLRRILASEISQIWICLEDSRPLRIRGYGVMADATAESLEGDLQEMLRIAHSLMGLLNS